MTCDRFLSANPRPRMRKRNWTHNVGPKTTFNFTLSGSVRSCD